MIPKNKIIDSLFITYGIHKKGIRCMIRICRLFSKDSDAFIVKIPTSARRFKGKVEIFIRGYKSEVINIQDDNK
jgi:hypothetical protein